MVPQDFVVATGSHPLHANERRVLDVMLLAELQTDEPRPLTYPDIIGITRLGRGPTAKALGGLKAQNLVSQKLIEGEMFYAINYQPRTWRPRAARRVGFARGTRTHHEYGRGSSSFLEPTVMCPADPSTHHENGSQYSSREPYSPRVRPLTKEAARVANAKALIQEGQALDRAAVVGE
jgi:hypothetical protein